ncbi:MAG: PBP1A family penicillin-binding protein [Vicinamibacterales bacterium]
MAVRYVVQLPVRRGRLRSDSRRAASRGWLLAAAVLTLAVGSWATTLAFAWAGATIVGGLPSRDAVRSLGQMARATTLYDVDGHVVFTLFKEQRIEVPLEAMSPYVKQAVLSVEDQRFYQHAGIDVVRLFGAALANLRVGRVTQGASTITQQLARQDLLSRERTFTRKLREMLVAARIEQTFTKDQILELYLNKVYFGNGLYGIEAAARGYFGKPSKELDVAEAALLAGLIKSPSTYAPTISLEKATARRAVVLQLMQHEGFIDEAARQAAVHADVHLHNGLRHDENFGLYFKEAVRQELVERFGWERVSEGGLRVFTTLDTTMQQSAEDVVERSLAAIEARRNYRHGTRAAALESGSDGADYLQGALLALDPETGEVRALVGGRDFASSPFNRAMQAKRQPGSAFKPFVYAAAIEAGYTPATLLTNLDDPVLTEEGEEWVPEDEHLESAEITMRDALRTSSNRAAVRVIRDVGVRPTVDFVERLNLGPVPAVPSLALGTGEVTLEAMTAAYSSFAAGGKLRRPHLVRRVEDATGAVIWAAPDDARQAVAPTTAFIVASMMQDVIDRGTGSRARAGGFVLPAAGKTGTTNDYADAWFVGFTPHLVTGVWVGFDQPRTIISRGYAAELAVPLWADFMRTATKGAPADWLTPPPGIVLAEVCSVSGDRPSAGCHEAHIVTTDGRSTVGSTIRTDFFVAGTEPTAFCRVHPGPGLLERLARSILGDPHAAGEPVSMTPPPTPSPFPTPGTSSPSAGRPGSTHEATRDGKADDGDKKRGFWSRIFGKGRDKERKPGGGPP